MVVTLLLGGAIWHSEKRGKAARSPSKEESAKPQARASKVEIASLSLADSVPEWTASQGSFRMVEIEGRTTLEIGHEPMAEGRLVWSRLITKYGTIRARMWGERSRRSAPRFALGVAGASSYWLRAVPLEKKLQIVGKEERVLAAVPWDETGESPIWLELRLAPPVGEAAAGPRLEGRVWRGGESRPDAPSVEVALEEELGFARAVVAGAPFAMKPVYVESLEVSLQ